MMQIKPLGLTLVPVRLLKEAPKVTCQGKRRPESKSLGKCWDGHSNVTAIKQKSQLKCPQRTDR
jgi:hypothetical protein